MGFSGSVNGTTKKPQVWGVLFIANVNGPTVSPNAIRVGSTDMGMRLGVDLRQQFKSFKLCINLPAEPALSGYISILQNGMR